MVTREEQMQMIADQRLGYHPANDLILASSVHYGKTNEPLNMVGSRISRMIYLNEKPNYKSLAVQMFFSSVAEDVAKELVRMMPKCKATDFNRMIEIEDVDGVDQMEGCETILSQDDFTVGLRKLNDSKLVMLITRGEFL